MVLQTIPSVGTSVERIATQLSRIEFALSSFEDRLRSHESAINAIVISSQQDDTGVQALTSFVLAFLNFVIEIETFEVPMLQIMRDCAIGAPTWIIFAAALWHNMRLFVYDFYDIPLPNQDEDQDQDVDDEVNDSNNDVNVNNGDAYITVPVSGELDGQGTRIIHGNAPPIAFDKTEANAKRELRRKILLEAASILAR